MAIDNRPRTSVKVTKPKAAPAVTLRGLGVGSYFSQEGDDNIYIKTDETFGMGYRCMNIATGCLKAVNIEAVITVHYKKVEITVAEK